MTKTDLTRLTLPGGGTATFWKPEDLPTRKSQRLELSRSLFPARKSTEFIRALNEARAAHPDLEETDLYSEGYVALPEYTADEAAHMQEHQNLQVLTYLKDWTLKIGGEPIPVPQTIDDLLDNTPPKAFRAIQEHVNKIIAGDTSGQFGVEGVEDPESPTGA